MCPCTEVNEIARMEADGEVIFRQYQCRQCGKAWAEGNIPPQAMKLFTKR